MDVFSVGPEPSRRSEYAVLPVFRPYEEEIVEGRRIREAHVVGLAPFAKPLIPVAVVEVKPAEARQVLGREVHAVAVDHRVVHVERTVTAEVQLCFVSGIVDGRGTGDRPPGFIRERVV